MPEPELRHTEIFEMTEHARAKAEAIMHDGTGSQHEQDLAEAVHALCQVIDKLDRELVRLAMR
jgi:hypothetical protein